MADSSKAVFLSYAREDSEAARRIADALRAAGVEVWFDQSELRGGDAWDAKIRKQIKECALFVPIISANTQARPEGYFRIEWKLADRRTESIGKSKAFLLPVCIDDTREADADVPDSFLSVQWTRLPAGETSAAFGERVNGLLGAQNIRPPFSNIPTAANTGSNAPNSLGNVETRPAPSRHAILIAALIIAAVALGALILGRPWRAPARESSASASRTLPTSKTAEEVVRLRARLIPEAWKKEDFDPWSADIDRLIALDERNADAWALRSIINSLQVMRHYEAGTKPLEIGRSAAQRAQLLAAESPLAELALGMHHVAMISRGGDPRAGRPILSRALAKMPPDPLTRYADLASAYIGFDFDGIERATRTWLAHDPTARYPGFIEAQAHLALRNYGETMRWAERGASDGGDTGMRTHGVVIVTEYYLRGDLAAARAALDRTPSAFRPAHRIVYWSWFLAMAERRWDVALQELARTPESVFFEGSYYGPKALLAGLAHQAAGREEAALAQFREAERVGRELLAIDPQNERLHAVQAVTLACAGQAAEARNQLALVEPLLRGRPRTMYVGSITTLLAQAHAALGQIEPCVAWLREMFSGPTTLPFTPASLRIDPRFQSVIGSRQLQALLKEFAHLDAPKSPAGSTTSSSALDPKSIAVLPFENLSGEIDATGFADGMHEEVLTALAKVAALKVIGRTSVLPYRDAAKRDLRKIASDLNVGSVVEGTVQRSGNRVRIRVKLVDTQSLQQLWAKPFEEELTDMFAIQVAVAEEIATTLRATFTERERAVLERRLTENPRAYEFYLQAKLLYNDVANSSPLKDWERLVQLLESSIRADPNFAQAHALLARTHANLYWYGSLDPTAVRRVLAQESLVAAQRLAPNAAETRFAEGRFAYTSNREFAAAMRHYQAALVESPNDSALIFHIGLTHRQLGEHSAAADALSRAQQLNPLDVAIAGDLLASLVMMRRFVEAVSIGEKYAGLSAEFASVARFTETARFEVQGDRTELVRRLRGLPKAGADPHGLVPLYYGALFAGELYEAARLLADPRLISVTSIGNTILEPVALHRALIARLRGQEQPAQTHAAEAEAALRTRASTTRQEPVARLAMIRAVGYAGRNADAQQLASELRRHLGTKNGIDEIGILNELGRLYALIGAREEAFALLRKLMSGPNSPFFGTPRMIQLDPCWSRLADDPRFEEILKAAKPL